ncbi:MAG: DUF1501 domain-containing protein [Proteobacteria bacterium]|nr:DUF1501 domain-containing protein [Pseudomonadota bacterium]
MRRPDDTAVHEHDGCGACEAELAFTPPSLTRRVFLRSGAMALIGAAMLPGFLTRAAVAAGSQSGRRGRVLVTVFLRGAVDGLNIVIPYREPEYYRLRRSVAVPAPRTGGGDETALDLDGTFGLHPALAPLQALYQQRHLAFILATGSPDPTRSHFDAQDYMESAAPGNKSISDGWLNRMLAAQKLSHETQFRAVSMSTSVPRSLQGSRGALAIPDVRSFGVRGGGAAMQKGFEGMYESGVHDVLHGTGRESFEAVDALRKRLGSQPYAPSNGATYPTAPFGRQMQQVAQLIKADLGVEVASTDIGGWDTHANEGGSKGQLANNLRILGQTLAAFAQDMGDGMEDIIILTMSEFGRKLEENGSGGTDHGHGNLNMIIGGRVRGGQVHGRWPGLAREQLFEGRDLAVTTDFRDVFAEVLTRHMQCRDAAAVFPGYAISPSRFPGAFA